MPTPPALLPEALRFTPRVTSSAFPSATILNPSQMSALEQLGSYGPMARTTAGIGGRIPGLGGTAAFEEGLAGLGARGAGAAGNAAGALPNLWRAGSGAVGAAEGAAESALPLFTKGSALKGGLYGLAGQVGSSVIDRTGIGGHNSNLEQGLQGAAQGAGVGAGLGLLGGPFAELTVPAGALIGGAVGALGGVLGNKFGHKGKSDEAKVKDQADGFVKLINQYTTAGSPEREYLTKTLGYQNISIDASDASKKDKLAAKAQVIQQLGALLNNYVSTNQGSQIPASLTGQQGSAGAPTAQDMIAMQAIIGDIMKPYTTGMVDAGNANAQLLNSYADQVGGAQGQAYRLQASQSQSGNARLAAAYNAQAQLAPQMMALEQARQAAYQQPSTSSGDGFDGLVAQLTAGGTGQG